MPKKIIRRDYEAENAQALSTLHPLLQRVFAARNVKNVIELEKNLEQLIPYQALLGIEKAVNLLAEALLQHKRLLIVGDFDADGATSTAIAMRALKQFGARHVQFLVPNRFAYGYGLTPELVAQAAKEMAPDVIVTVDNGIANHAGVDAAKALGIQVIITDHHLPAATLPNADAIVNPNQPNDTFPSKCLAGCGVIFYVMLALRRELKNRNWFEQQHLSEPNMAALLDLVALGTVADLVPLDHNNRILVHQGLRRIRAGQCVPAIAALLELAGRDLTRTTAADLGFAVAARLNAAGRLDDMSLGINCLLNDDAASAREAARILDQLNDERRHIEQDMQAQALTALDALSTSLKGTLPRGLCLYDAGWHQGVIGILASRIKERFHRPAVVFAPGQADELKGSARSIPSLHIRDTFAWIDAHHPGLILKFGGHAMAAGLSIKHEHFPQFADVFNEAVSRQLSEEQLEHSLLSDGELNPDEFNLELAGLLREAGPWGQAFPEPLFDGRFKILEQRLVGDKHLKLRLGKESKVLDAIAFFVDTDTWPNHRCDTIQAVYRLDINEYKGRRNVQLIIDYFEESTASQ
jgi:single-stranded-DNA-specific exonuclease